MGGGVLGKLLASSGDDMFERLVGKAKGFKSLDDFTIHQPTAFEPDLQDVVNKFTGAGMPINSADDLVTLYHGTNSAGMKGINDSGSFNPLSYFATDRKASDRFAFGRDGGVMEIQVPARDVPYVHTPMANANGFSVQNPSRLIRGEDNVWRAEQLPTYQQIVDAYKAAHGDL